MVNLTDKRVRGLTLVPLSGCVMPLAAVVLVLVLLQALSCAPQVSPSIPRPSSVALVLVQWSTDRLFLGTLIRSILRFTIGYLIAFLAGAAIGLGLGTSPLMFRIVRPSLEVIRPLPVPAVIPLLIAYLGLGDTMRGAAVVFASIWPILLATCDSARRIDRSLLDLALLFRLNSMEKLFKVVLPGSLPGMMAGMRTSTAVALIAVLLSEMIGASDGLGAYLVLYQRTFQTNKLYALLIVVATLGFALNRLFLYVEERVLFWHVRSTLGTD